MLMNTTRRQVTSSIRSLGGVRFYTEGSTGAPRPEGQGDSFSKREKASEDYYVRQHEAEKLKAYKKLQEAQQEYNKQEQALQDAKQKAGK